jgi:hypothetical protein
VFVLAPAVPLVLVPLEPPVLPPALDPAAVPVPVPTVPVARMSGVRPDPHAEMRVAHATAAPQRVPLSHR